MRGGGALGVGCHFAARCRDLRRPKLIRSSKLRVQNRPQIVRPVQAEHPGKTVHLGALAEHRIGLKSMRRRVGARRGHRPIAIVPDR
jgi:hypothetical protein